MIRVPLAAAISVALALPGAARAAPRTHPARGYATTEALALRTNPSGDQALALLQRLSGRHWLASPSPLFEVDATRAVEVRLDIAPLANAELELTLHIRNTAPDSTPVDAVFPQIAHLSPGGDAQDLWFCFPARDAVISNQPGHHVRPYGGEFPLQFVDVFHRSWGGIYLATRDLDIQPKTFHVEKSGGEVTLRVERRGKDLAPGEEWVLRAALGAHEGDWHDALAAYRDWVETWFRPAAPRKPWFQDIYNFRQLFLHQNPVLGEHPGVFDPESGDYRFEEFLREDSLAFGAIEHVHLFDWGMDFVHGRVGDYSPWSYLGGIPPLRAEIEHLHARGIGVGLYFEGYLVDPPSLVAQAHGETWQLLDSRGLPYTNFAPSYHLCPHVTEWQDYLRNTFRRARAETGASAFYIDELGFGTQYPCYNPAHGHRVGVSQLAGEQILTAKIRAGLPPEAVLYTEEAPADVARQDLDGSFTYTLAHARANPQSTAKINLARFALPTHKSFEILRVDAPLDDDQEGVKLVFFNGEGLWLEGYLEDDPWFDPLLCATIRKTHRILRAQRRAFADPAPTPLVPTLDPALHANRFEATGERVWTLHNSSADTLCGTLLELRHEPGARYRDAWNGRPLTPVLVGDRARLDLTLAPADVGCVVQELAPRTPPALLGHWCLDERANPSGGTTAVDSSGMGNHGVYRPLLGTGPVLGRASVHDTLYATAADFDGVEDDVVIELGLPPSGPINDLSISAWIRPERSGEQSIFAGGGEGGGGLDFGLGGDGSDLVFRSEGIREDVRRASVATGTWTHVALVIDRGNDALFYVDGVDIGRVERDTPPRVAGGNYFIASDGVGSHFAGGLDDLRVYRGTLTRSEIRVLAESTGPLAGSVVHADGALTRDTNRLELWWPGFWDAMSGIAAYRVGVGRFEGDDSIHPFTDVGEAASHTFTDLELDEGEVVCTVRATNGVGLTVQRSSRTLVAPPELLGHWPLDDPASKNPTGGQSEPTPDSSSHGHDALFQPYQGPGARVGEPSVDPALGSAFEFDGADDELRIPTPHSINELLHDFTLTAWVDPFRRPVPGSSALVFGQGGSGGFRWGIFDTWGGFEGGLILTTPGVRDYLMPFEMPLGTWTHLAVVLDPYDDATFYVNGERLGGARCELPALPGDGPCFISGNGSFGRFEGRLDEVRIYRGELGEAALRELAEIDRCIADLVQEQSSSRGGLEKPALVRRRSREGALRVAEELRFQK